MGRKADAGERGRTKVGWLFDDLSSLAGQVQRNMCDGTVTVWADDDCGVFVCDARWAPTLPSHWVAGTYSFGHDHAAIQDDLRALLRDRTKDWIIEDTRN